MAAATGEPPSPAPLAAATGEPPCEKESENARVRKAAVTGIALFAFQTMAQVNLANQTEPLLAKSLCAGDAAVTARLLSNDAGLASFAGLLLNEVGGRLSDSYGRRPAFMIAPAANLMCFLALSLSPRLSIVRFCRAVRMMVQNFVIGVMVTAGISDVAAGAEFGDAYGRVMAAISVGVTMAPLAESSIIRLRRSQSPSRAVYLFGAASAALQLACAARMPETLSSAKGNVSWLSINPFGFVRIYRRRGETLLKKLLTICQLFHVAETRNLASVMQMWQLEHLGWGVMAHTQNGILQGLMMGLTGGALIPALLTRLSARAFTTLTTLLNGIGWALRGCTESATLYSMAIPLSLPNHLALRPLAQSAAMRSGFGHGEFAAYYANMRSLAGAFAHVFFGNYYALCRRAGSRAAAGSTFLIAGAVGCLLPWLQLRALSDGDLHLKSIEDGDLPVKSSSPLDRASCSSEQK